MNAVALGASEMKTSFGVVARPKVPDGYNGVWINIYIVGGGRSKRIHAGGAYPKRYMADAIAKSWRKDCVFVIAKIK